MTTLETEYLSACRTARRQRIAQNSLTILCIVVFVFAIGASWFAAGASKKAAAQTKKAQRLQQPRRNTVAKPREALQLAHDSTLSAQKAKQDADQQKQLADAAKAEADKSRKLADGAEEISRAYRSTPSASGKLPKKHKRSRKPRRQACRYGKPAQSKGANSILSRAAGGPRSDPSQLRS